MSFAAVTTMMSVDAFSLIVFANSAVKNGHRDVENDQIDFIFQNKIERVPSVPEDARNLYVLEFRKVTPVYFRYHRIVFYNYRFNH